MHIREFQSMMRRIYFHRDSERGKDAMYKWLLDEAEELREALEDQDVRGLEGEFADVLAWLASLANVVNIDLEKAALTKYNNTCPKCQKARCECPFERR